MCTNIGSITDPVEGSVYLVNRYIIDVCAYQWVDYRGRAGIKAYNESYDEPYHKYNDKMHNENRDFLQQI